jgi:hypothetical protein
MKAQLMPNRLPIAAQEQAEAKRASLCEVNDMKTQLKWTAIALLMLAACSLTLRAQAPAEGTNAAAASVATNAPGSATRRDTTARAGSQPTPSSARQGGRPTTQGFFASSPSFSSGSDFNSFQLIAQRNIFDGTRTGQTIRSGGTGRIGARVDAFALVGTLISEKGTTAFFDGTDPEFRRAYKTGGRIAGYEITEIKFSGARLVQGSNTVDIAVGTGLARENGGLWKPSATPISSLASASSSRTSDNFGGFDARTSFLDTGRNNNNFSRGGRGRMPNNTSFMPTQPTPTTITPSPPVSAAEVDAVLQRLMQQREKE